MTGDVERWIGHETVSQGRLEPDAIAKLRGLLDKGDEEGAEVPPGAHWLLAPPIVPSSRRRPDGHPESPLHLAPRRMWAGSDIQFLAPIAADADCRRTSRIAAISRKAGRQGPLWLVTIDHAIHASGRTALRERQTIVYLEGRAGGRGDEAVDDRDWQARRMVYPDPLMLFLYSALTFNAHRIHYDRPYAVEVENYPGLVVQGPLIATLLLDLCCERFGGPESFRFRAISPAYSDENLELVGRGAGKAVELAALAPGGRCVMNASAMLAANG